MKRPKDRKQRIAEQKRGEKRHRRQVERKKKAARRRHAEKSGPSPASKTNQTLEREKDHLDIKAPKQFSLIDNTEEVIKYFNHCEYLISNRGGVSFDFSEIESVTSDAIAFFIAHFNDPSYSKNNKLKGNLPKDETLLKRFKKSGMLDHVDSTIDEPAGDNNFLLHKITKNKVENETAKQVAKSGSEYAIGPNARVRPIYEILIECMANTNNHAAGPDGEISYDWWLVVNSSEQKRKVNYTILDLGVGVFESSPIRLYKSTLYEKFKTKISHNADLVDDLVAGKIKSSTGLEHRGKGIPLIYQRSHDRRIANSVMISNNVFYNFCTGEKKRLDASFSGTLIHFELSAEDEV